jgi:hypothetical protein
MKRGKIILKKQVMRKVLNEFIKQKRDPISCREKELRKTIKQEEMKLTLSILGIGLSNLVKW